MNRSKKAFLNLSSQLLLQAVTAICGFIVPKLILESFGSELNGMVTSISQFLGIIALMESGFGSVAKTAFYKPLASRDRVGISGIYNATESFFRKVAYVFLVYCGVLAFVFPLINKNDFGYFFTVSLVLIIGINSFMQYYFGISYSLLFNADQQSYIGAFLQIATIILNAVLMIVLLKVGASIHVVKLVSAGVFIIKPILINLYGKRKYRVDSQVPKDDKSLSQKWDNLGQSIALYVHTKTSFVYITVFLNFVEVSVYSVYSLITTSLSAIITSISTGFVSSLGNIYANREKENFEKIFSLYEFVNTVMTFSLYTIALVLMIPFVKLYTQNLTDTNYIRPIFGFLLILSELIYCIRLPYYYMVTNAGHFKQMKKGAYVEAAINIILSLCLVKKMGIVGLAIATTVAMACRTVEVIIYCSKNITCQNVTKAVMRIAVNCFSSLGVILVSHFIMGECENFLEWIIYAVIIGAIAVVIIGGVSFIFYRKDYETLLQRLKNVVRR